ncbi:MAG TPA: hypothetical protein PLS49_01435 [Candidatus Woesebacteria bacterium]|nr:hypothetical protein [Candidatus Woesebacteria bacterium]
MVDQQGEFSPTLKALESSTSQENLQGSPLIKKRSLFGKDFSFYDDGSVLVVNPEKQEYHFMTQEGRNIRKGVTRSVAEIIENDKRLNEMKLLGEGKGGLSKVFQLDTPNGPIAVKATDQAGFYLKEISEQITTQHDFPSNLHQLERSEGRKIIQKMSLADTMRLFTKLDKAGIQRPEFYGFTVRRDPGNNEIQEFQFMERINKPTIEEVIQAELSKQDSKETAHFPYAADLEEICTRYFEGNQDTFHRALFTSFTTFVRGVKEAVPNIADLETDNIFLVGYDEKNREFDFMVIDPIEEFVFIKPKPITKDEYFINYNNSYMDMKIPNNFNSFEEINFPNKSG